MSDDLLKNSRILLVDDEPQNVRYLEDVLRWAGYERIESTTDARQALPAFLRFQPDLVILDLLMPELDGFAVLEAIQEHRAEDDYLPILILTSDVSREARRRALGAGAKDFLTKPMSPTEVGIRVGNLLEARFLHLRCRQLEDGDTDKADGTALDEALEGWAATVDGTSSQPGAHAVRVADEAARIGAAMGLPEERVRTLRRAALLHDVPAAALAVGRSELLGLAREIATAHDRSWTGDAGTGSLPLEARIVAVAHRLDRLKYGPSPCSETEALARLEAEAGDRLDPAIVSVLTAGQVAETA